MEVTSSALGQTASQVKLQKGQLEQEGKVVNTLIESTKASAPKGGASLDSGGLVNVTA